MKRSVRFVCLILALILVAALFTGCGGGQQQQQQQQNTPAPAADTPKPTSAETELVHGGDHETTEDTEYADEITYGCGDVGVSLNVLNPAAGGQISQIECLMVYNTLLSRDPVNLDGFLPELAYEWYADAEAKNWTFKLRDDVYFTNGEKLTAEDVRFSWETFMAHPGSIGTLKLSDVEDVEVVNDYEVIYHLKGTNVDFENNISDHGTLIMCKKAVEADEENGPLIGSGVWKLDDFKSNTYIRLVANENTWEEPAKAKVFTFKSVSEATAKTIMFENGELDFITDVPPQYRAQYEADPNLALDTFNSSSTHNVLFNMLSPIGGNKDFRYACAYAIDREAITLIATEGTGRTWDSMALWGYGTAYKRDDLPIWERDLDKAKEYLEKSGYKGEEVLLLTVSSGAHATVGQVVQQQLGDIGINVKIFNSDTATLMSMSAWGSNQYDMMVWSGPWQSIPSSCFFNIQTGLIGNKAQFSNARVDELLVKGAATPNGPERQAIYYEIQGILADELPYIGIYNQVSAYGRQANCGGVVYWPEGIIDCTYAYKILEE